jgi:hypothetical protein
MRHKPLKVKSPQKNLNSLKVKTKISARNQKTKSRLKRQRPKRRRDW